MSRRQDARRVKRDPETYGRIARKYDRWVENEAARPERPRVIAPPREFTPEPEPAGTDMNRMVSAAIGVGIAVLLLALAAFSFYTAAAWAAVDRDGASTGYTVVGLFLAVAGVGGIIATLNHNFRVLTQPPAHH